MMSKIEKQAQAHLIEVKQQLEADELASTKKAPRRKTFSTVQKDLNGPLGVEAQQALWLERFSDNARVSKNVVRKNMTHKNEVAVDAYLREFGNLPRHTEIVVPELTPFNEEIKHYEGALDDRERLIHDRIEGIEAITFDMAELSKTLKVAPTGRERAGIRVRIDALDVMRTGFKHEIDSATLDIKVLQSNLAKAFLKKKEALQPYIEGQRSFNNSVFQTEPFPNESEEEYIERMRANEELDTQQSLLFKAENLIERRFKQNLRLIIKNPTVIDEINSSIDEQALPDEDQDIESVRQIINERWGKFLERFVSTYGKDAPDSLNAPMFNAFVKRWLSGNAPEAPFKKELSESELKEDTVREGFDGGDHYGIDGSLLLAWKGSTVLWSKSNTGGDRGTWHQYSSYELQKIKDETGVTRAQIKAEIGNVGVKAIMEFLRDEQGLPPLAYKVQYMKDPKTGKVTRGAGLGFSAHQEEVPIGTLTLFLRHLLQNNILKVRKCSSPLKDFPAQKVSDDFVRTIYTLVSDKKVNPDEYHSLDSVERALFDRLMETAQGSYQSGVGRKKDDLVRDLEIIRGEVEAGNDNPVLIKDAKHILHQLFRKGFIDCKERVAYLKELQEHP